MGVAPRRGPRGRKRYFCRPGRFRPRCGPAKYRPAAPTPETSRVKNYAREVVALPHSVARVVWRRFVRRVLGR